MEEINGVSSRSSSSSSSSSKDDGDDFDSEYRRQAEAERRVKRGESAQDSDNQQRYGGDYNQNDNKIDLGFFSKLDPITKNVVGFCLFLFIVGVFIWGFKTIKSYDKPKKEKKVKNK